MNGGPFHRDGSLVGAVLIEDGTIVSDDFGSTVGLGVASASSSKFWIMGRLDSAEQALELGVQQFVSGFDWLVYNGRNIAANRSDTTGALRAARSALGIASNGTLLLLVSDGCEHWYVVVRTVLPFHLYLVPMHSAL